MGEYNLESIIGSNFALTYNKQLRLNELSPHYKTKCLHAIFDRDIRNNTELFFNGKQIYPTKVDNSPKDSFDRLYTHLTCWRDKKNRNKPHFDIHRSRRLHWIKYHLSEENSNNILIFSYVDKEGYRTYIYDRSEKYVIILEPYRKQPGYYLITAYYCNYPGKAESILSKYERRLEKIL